jgi:putative hydrolase of the HAD superfamily
MRCRRKLDAVTLDAFGTLLELADPVPALQDALADHGVVRGRDEVARAFRAEAAFYVPRSLEGRDERTLAALRRRCAAVFLDALGAELDPGEFATALVRALAYRPIHGVPDALERLRAGGLELACVANWDYTLPGHLAAAGLLEPLAAVVTSAEAGFAKPDPRIFALALERLRADPARALHVGDGAVDREGARAAGLAFAPVPVATLPGRLGLG